MLRIIVPIIVALLTVVAGCGSSVDLDLPTAGKLDLTIRDGANTAFCDVEASSPGVNSVTAWLEANRDGWQSSMVTYAPTVQLNGDGFSLNFVGELAVVNHANRQLTHPVPAEVFTDLVCP